MAARHECEGKPSSKVVSRCTDAIAEPVRDDNANIVCDEDQREVGAAVMCLGKLGNSWGDNGVDEANANACDDSCANEPVGVLTGGHQGSAQHAEERANPDTPFAAQFVTDPACACVSPLEASEPVRNTNLQ
jgi:hypothetical protein